MTRFVELPTVNPKSSPIWVNPDHVVTVSNHYRDAETCWLATEMGTRHHIALSPDATVECLEDRHQSVRSFVAAYGRLDESETFDVGVDDDVDLRDSVRENLNR